VEKIDTLLPKQLVLPSIPLNLQIDTSTLRPSEYLKLLQQRYCEPVAKDQNNQAAKEDKQGEFGDLK